MLSQPVSIEQNILSTLAPPADVQDFAINVVAGTAHLSWSPVKDLDLSHYRIKCSPTKSEATWGSATDLVPQVSGTATSVSVPAISGTYFIKAVDLSPNGGVESVNAALIVSNVASLTGLNVVGIVTEAPAFAGQKTNVIKIGDRIQLDSAVKMASWTTLASIQQLAAGVVSNGTYDFDGTLDLGDTFTSQLLADTTAVGDNFSNVLGSWPTLSSVADISGTDPGEWGLTLEVRTTDDDPGGTPTWSAWAPFVIGDYTTRAFEWRAQLYSTNPVVTPLVTGLEVEVDMPDRVDGADDIVCPAEGLTVAFVPAFKAKPAIAVSGPGYGERRLLHAVQSKRDELLRPLLRQHSVRRATHNGLDGKRLPAYP